MGRAENRRKLRNEMKAKTKTYNLTKDQLETFVKESIQTELQKVQDKATSDAVNTAMVLLFTLPLEVLMDHYWPKTYEKKIPEFTNYLLEYYEKWQNGELDINELKEDLWKYGGVILEEVEE